MPEPSAHSQNPVDFPVRVAAVDLGSNALRFGAAEFSSPEEYRILENLRVPVRLGHGVFLTKYLDAALIDQAVEALKGFRRRMDDLGVGLHRAAATSAVRESRNAHELTARIWEEAAIRVDPIGGIEEGRLVWRAISNRVPVEGRRWLLADLGGGSVEVSLASSGQLSWTESLPLGTVRLLEALGVDPEAPTTPLRRLLELPAPEMARLPGLGPRSARAVDTHRKRYRPVLESEKPDEEEEGRHGRREGHRTAGRERAKLGGRGAQGGR